MSRVGRTSSPVTALSRPAVPWTVVVLVLLVTLVGTVLAPGIARAQGPTYVVAPYGRDDGRGDVHDPWRTIDAAVARLQPGDTLLVRGGEYSSPYGLHGPVDILHKRGTAAHPIRIAAYPGERPVRRGTAWQVFRVYQSSYVTIEGFEVVGTALGDHAPTNGVEITESHHIVVRNNLIHDVGGGGVASMRSDHVWVDGNQIWGTAKWSSWQTSAISFFQSVDSNSGPGLFGLHNLAVNNIIHHNETLVPGPEGIITDGNCIIVDSNRAHGYTGGTGILNNICVANGGRGINVTRSDNVVVVNNTVSGNVNRIQQPGAELTATYSSNVTFRNNLVSPNRPDLAMIVWDVQNVVTENNVYVNSQPARIGPGDVIVPSLPLFLGAIPGDGSAATDAGTPVGAPAIDAFGNPRKGRPDAGAVER
jgi:parallel beta-helix repeat protein